MAKRKQALLHETKKTSTVSPAEVPAAAQGRESFWWVGIAAALLGFCLYANTLNHDYCYDDSSAIINNYLVKGGIRNIGEIFATEYRAGYQVRRQAGLHYRPLTLAVFALLWDIAPNRPGLYHCVNALLYALTGWLLWITWRRILHRHPPLLPALGVLLFMAHPVHTEVVANIKSLDEILALLLCTAALYGLWRSMDERNPLWLAGALAAYGMALLCKESPIVFLAVFPLTLWFFSDKKLGQILKISGWFLLPTALFLAARVAVLAGQAGQAGVSGISNAIALAPDWLSRLATACAMCWRYLAVLVAPLPLVSDMGYPQVRPVTFADWRAFAGLAAYGGAGLWALREARNRFFPAFAILFSLISFSLVSNVFMLTLTSYGERLLYVPSLGFALGLAWVLLRLFPPALAGMRQPALFWAVAATVLALYSVKTVSRTPDWKNDRTLYEADIKVSPGSAMLMHHLGVVYLQDGYDRNAGVIRDAALVEKSIGLLTKAYDAYPNSQTINYRGQAYSGLKKYDQAIADYEKAIVHKPDYPDALCSLGYLYRNVRNQQDKAEELYRRAVAADPRFVKARRNLGALLAVQGKFKEAIEQWSQGLKYAPDDLLLNQYIGRAYSDMGQPDQGKPFLEKAGRLKGVPAGASSMKEESAD